jgi:APA family basic amino acid/polyamine antiporter
MEATSLAAPRAPAAAAQPRKLGLWMVTALVIGNMIGAGVFLLPASLGPYGGISIVGWGISAAGSACLALVFAHLGQILPRSGGPYAYAHAAFGDFGGFLIAWTYWISCVVGLAALATAFVSYTAVFVPALASVPALGAVLALVAIWGLAAVNVAGLRQAGAVQVVTVVLKLLPLAAIIGAGFFSFDPSHFTPFNASGQDTLPAISATVALTLWAFFGLECATVPAEDVHDPVRTIPRATLLGTGIATVVYVLGTVAVMGVIPPATLATSTAPFADAARTLFGSWGAYGVAAGASISAFGALNGWVLVCGQLPMAAARDRVLPALFARLSPRGTPRNAIVISVVLASLMIAANYTRGLVGAFTFIVLLATVAGVVPFVFTSAAVFLIADGRRSRARLGAGIGLIAGVAFLYSLWVIAGSGRDAVFWGFLLMMAGLPLYVWMARR